MIIVIRTAALNQCVNPMIIDTQVLDLQPMKEEKDQGLRVEKVDIHITVVLVEVRHGLVLDHVLGLHVEDTPPVPIAAKCQ